MAKYSLSPHELQTVEDHIIKHFGNISRTIPVKESENLDLRIYVIEPTKESLNVFYLYYYFKKNSIEGYGTSQQQITIPYLLKKKILFPKKSIMAEFGIYVAKLFDKINILKEKNKNLIKQRDLLLPRLMSGKLEV